MAVVFVLFIAQALLLGPASAQAPDAASTAAQKEAMKVLAAMDGAWRGPAWMILPSGEKHEITQTERVGPFLDGAVKVIEGKGYDASGGVAFNAFATVSFDAAKKTYSMRSYAMGRSGDFNLTPTPDGFIWEVPAGPMTIRYTATVKNGEWREVGERIMQGQEPVKFFEMNLKRIGDTDWPAGDAVPAK